VIACAVQEASDKSNATAGDAIAQSITESANVDTAEARRMKGRASHFGPASALAPSTEARQRSGRSPAGGRGLAEDLQSARGRATEKRARDGTSHRECCCWIRLA
jgi:hypothetical protein